MEKTPQIVISKAPQSPDLFHRPFRFFENARSAFRSFLEKTAFDANEIALLPSYVGWSPKEGSGVFDPVAQLRLSYDFYRMDDILHIDLDHLRFLFTKRSVKLLIIIHFFGYVDPGYEEAIAMAREYGALVLEDEAHAMLTDLVGGICGRLGDACIFSLHKLFPVETGGMLLLNQPMEHLLDLIRESNTNTHSPWEFDLKAISRKRRENAQLLSQLLRPLAGRIDPLWGDPQPGEIPQTYPVIVQHGSRDSLYFAMNDAGFGVVSLYHTLIDEIVADTFPASHRLSRCILNLPVHQDVQSEDLEVMVEVLARVIDS
jgi:dTDP-4-amino-4,6-dideoxygalactose transaminase